MIEATRPRVTVFLGAGFSAACGLPVAGELFDRTPDTDDVLKRRRIAEAVPARWHRWREEHGGEPEEYLGSLEGVERTQAVQFVALRLVLAQTRVGVGVVGGVRLVIMKHNLDRTSCRRHEQFWDALFDRHDVPDVTVLTTNYDVMAERGLRHEPRPRAHRPGFHYGFGPEALAGGGYPSYTHIQKIVVRGTVPLLKLHGSISWSIRDGSLVRYHDCRPGIRGDAAIVAPARGKRRPSWSEPTWKLAREALAASPTWLVVGYRFPSYDREVIELLQTAARVAQPEVHLFGASAAARAAEISNLLDAQVTAHGRIPEAIDEVRVIEWAP